MSVWASSGLVMIKLSICDTNSGMEIYSRVKFCDTIDHLHPLQPICNTEHTAKTFSALRVKLFTYQLTFHTCLLPGGEQRTIYERRVIFCTTQKFDTKLIIRLVEKYDSFNSFIPISQSISFKLDTWTSTWTANLCIIFN